MTTKRFAMMLAAFIVAVTPLALVSCGNDSPSSVVESFLAAAKAKDCEAMVNYIDTEGSTAPRDELVKACQQQSQLGEITGYRIVEEKVDGDQAQVTVEVSTSSQGQDETTTDTLTVVKRDGEWKLATQ